MGEKFKLHFKSDEIGLVAIDEPIGFNTLDFDFMQKQKGLSRDISFNGGEYELEFTHTREHYLPELLYYFNYFGFEAKVEFIIEIEGVDNIIGDLDFAKSSTDGLEYFKCKIIQDSKLQTIKRRSKVKVNLFDNKDLDKSPIDPIKTYDILVKSKSIFSETILEKNTEENSFREMIGSRINAFYVMPTMDLKKSNLRSSSLPFNKRTRNANDFLYFRLEENARNLSITFSDISFFLSRVDYAILKAITYELVVQVGDEKYILRTGTMQANESYVAFGDSNLSFQTQNIARGTEIKIYCLVYTNQPPSSISEVFNFYIEGAFSIDKITANADLVSYNSLSKGVRLFDVMSQVIKSYSGLNIESLKFGKGGEFYDTFILNGNLLRGRTEKPFEISLDMIEESLTEMNADYEVNDTVFFGTYEEFYRNEECGFFDETQFAGFNKKFNEKYAINTFNYKYNSYQSLKENEKPNTSDTIHGETTMLLGNKMVENTKNVKVEWIRDAFLIEEARKNSIKITDDTSSQTDNDIFALDCYENIDNLTFTEQSELKHEWENNLLTLRSTETLNFTTIGIFENTTFLINAPDRNTGTYTIVKVSPQDLKLRFVSGAVMSDRNDGVRFTQYTYKIPKEKVSFITRTNQEFTTSNLAGAENFNNLNYSVKRNIIRFYEQYLATANLFHKSQPISNSSYYHNTGGTISYNGLTTTENMDIIPQNPILSPYIFENMVYSNVDIIDFINLQKELRRVRGYVRGIDKNGNPIKVYPKKMTYKNLEKELTIVGEEKYEPIVINLQTSSRFTTINDETKVSSLIWELEDNQISFFDRSGYRLYSPIFWYNLSINGTLSDTKNKLIDRLKIIK